MAEAQVISITTKRGIVVPESCEATANHNYYLVSAILDIMETTFSQRQAQEGVLGVKGSFLVSVQKVDLIMHLLYEVADGAKNLRSALET